MNEIQRFSQVKKIIKKGVSKDLAFEIFDLAYQNSSSYDELSMMIDYSINLIFGYDFVFKNTIRKEDYKNVQMRWNK